MKLTEHIDKYIADKKRCFINGMPDGDTMGIITKREEDFIVFETLNVQTEKKTQKEKKTSETIIIPIDKIDIISEGEIVKETNVLDKALKALEE